MKYKILAASVLFISFFMIWVPMTADILVQYWYESHTAEIATAQQLRTEVGLEIIDETLLKSNGDFKTIPDKITLYLKLEDAIKAVPEYRAQKQKIMSRFDTLASDFQADSAQYSYLGLDYLGISTSSFTFEQKKDPYAVLSVWAKTLRDKIIAYNLTASTPLRFAIDPSSELALLSNKEKIAQMFIFSLNGNSLNNYNAELLRNSKVGGVVLFGPNVSGDVTAFNNQLQTTNPVLPLFIQVDQEGGTVRRIASDPTPGPKQIAEMDEVTRCQTFTERDTLLASLGFNWNLGLVADVTTSSSSFIFQRVYGGDYALVADIITNGVECSTATLTTLKHFPGHGATEAGTHQTVAHITKDEESWSSTDLLPFSSGLEAGSDSIMLAHLYLDFLDSTNPASLSPAVVEYVRTLDSDVLIVSDDMHMLDASGFDRHAALKSALVAGLDVIIYSLPISESADILSYAESLLNDGTITLEEVDEHVLRILETKAGIVNDDLNVVPFHLVNPGHMPS